MPKYKGVIFDFDGTLVETDIDTGDYDRSLEVGYKANADKFLHGLVERKKTLAIVTTAEPVWINKFRYQNPIIRRAADMNKIFGNRIITADMVKHIKPDPEGHFLALKMMGLNPDEVLMIEDSLIGAQAAAAVPGLDTCIIYEQSADKDRAELLKLARFHIRTYDDIVLD